MKKIWQTFIARNKEFFRDRAALGWSLAFPIMLVIGFSFLFDDDNKIVYQVGVFDPTVTSVDDIATLQDLKFTKFLLYSSEDEAKKKLADHRIDLYLDFPAKTYWLNEESANSYLAEKVLRADITTDWSRQSVSTQAVRYVDWVLPGILAMNMMFGALYGLGYVLVNYRKNGVLRRFKATPISVFEFLVAQICSRMLVILITTTIVLVGSWLTIGFKMTGNFLDLAVVFSLGTFCMISLGLIVSTRTTSKEFADGILNLMSWPMMLLSGVWFSIEGASPMLKTLAGFMPLTPVVDAMRAIMLEGATLSQVSGEVFTLLGISVVFLSIGAALFAWE